MKNLSYIITTQSVSVFIAGEAKVITNSHPVYNQLVEAIKAQDEAQIVKLLDVKRNIEELGEGKVAYKNGVVYYEGEPVNNYLTRKIVELQREGFTIEPLLNFLGNLQNNPSYRAREELYEFLEYGKLPITEDGYFIAYKKVGDDYKDIWSHTFDNSVGAVCEMERKDVDDNSNRTCSAGLHFASREYMSHYGSRSADKIMAIKINPADVVAIPQDYNNTKGRCCRYEVVAELGASNDFEKLEDEVVFTVRLGRAPKKKSNRKGERSAEGVSFDKSNGKWKAYYPSKPKSKNSRHIGYFATKKKAKRAVNKAMKELGATV